MMADGILDRLVHDAHRIEMRGDSMSKNRGKPSSIGWGRRVRLADFAKHPIKTITLEHADQ